MHPADSRTHRTCRALVALILLAAATTSLHAQLFSQEDWKELAAPPPPAYDLKRLVPVSMPAYMTLRFGIDPQTIRIGEDGVVRYVVIAQSARDAGGAFNAFYEGIRCATQEVKTYARASGDGWETTRDPEWKKIVGQSRHIAQLADQGICRGNAPRASVAEMVSRFKEPVRPVE